jgi:hypothetical protein
MNSETQQLSPSGSPAPQPRSSGKEIAKGIAGCFALNLMHLGIVVFLFLWLNGRLAFTIVIWLARVLQLCNWSM